MRTRDYDKQERIKEAMIDLILKQERPLLVSTHSTEEARLLGGAVLTLPAGRV